MVSFLTIASLIWARRRPATLFQCDFVAYACHGPHQRILKSCVKRDVSQDEEGPRGLICEERRKGCKGKPTGGVDGDVHRATLTE